MKLEVICESVQRDGRSATIRAEEGFKPLSTPLLEDYSSHCNILIEVSSSFPLKLLHFT